MAAVKIMAFITESLEHSGWWQFSNGGLENPTFLSSILYFHFTSLKIHFENKMWLVLVANTTHVFLMPTG